MKKTTKEKAPQPEKEPYMDPFELEDLIGRDRAKPFIERLDAVEKEQEEALREKTAAEERLARAKEAERFAYRMMQAALDRVRSVDLSDVLAAKPYDHDLRAILAQMDLTESGAWDQAARRHAKNPIPGVAAWEELVAAGATDVQIMTNLTKGFGGFNGKASGTHTLLKGNLWRGGMHDAGNKPILKDKALVAEVRRLLSIPLPPKPAPAAKAKPAAKAPAKSKAAKKTKEVEERADTSLPPAAPLKPFGEWAHAVKKVMKRRGHDGAVVKEERPWTGWHSARLAPAKAVAEWEAMQKIPDAAPPAEYLPGARIVVINPAGMLSPDVAYEPFDLGVNPGEIAAAVDRYDFNKPGVHALSAIVRYRPGDEHEDFIVREDRDHAGGDGLILLPLLKTAGAFKPTKDEPLLGRAVIVNNATFYVGPRDLGIRVDDPATPSTPGGREEASIGWGDVAINDVLREAGASFHGMSTLDDRNITTLGQFNAFLDDGGSTGLRKLLGPKIAFKFIDAAREWFRKRPNNINMTPALDPAEQPASDPIPDEEIDGEMSADDRDPPADPPPAPPVYRDHTLTRAQLQNAMAVDAVLRDKPLADYVVYRGRSYVVSGYADLDDGRLTRWYLHPTHRPDEWDEPTRTPTEARAEAVRGRPVEWDGLAIVGESGSRIILGHESERITLETPGPKAAAAEPAAPKPSKKKAAVAS